jgi:molybdopterin converting factor subunit 1
VLEIKVLYFAAVRELLGYAEESLKLPDSVESVGDLIAYLTDRHPVLRGAFRGTRVSVNQAFADPSQRLANADVVGVIPPVAGG